jgi:CRISPR/Cas system-associated protein Cas5 (RAMP superfamily)
MVDITQHPGYDLTLKQLEKEKAQIIEFNKKLSKPGYKFKDSIKPNYPKYLDQLIKMKQDTQLKLF